MGSGLGLAACDRLHVHAGVLTQRGGGWWTAFLSDRPRALAAGLWLTALPRVRQDLRFALLLAAAGPAVEAAVARTGAFAYARPLREVLPWLSDLYLHGAPLALATAAATPDDG